MKAGDMLFLSNGAANRDDSAFPNPNKFDVNRARTAEYLGFGHGMRYCLGNILARMETRMAIKALLEEFPNIQFSETKKPVFGTNLMLHGLLSLPVKLNR